MHTRALTQTKPSALHCTPVRTPHPYIHTPVHTPVQGRPHVYTGAKLVKTQTWSFDLLRGAEYIAKTMSLFGPKTTSEHIYYM